MGKRSFTSSELAVGSGGDPHQRGGGGSGCGATIACRGHVFWRLRLRCLVRRPPHALPFNEWTEAFGSERLTGALLDRLTHHVHILEMNGESYRLKDSKATASRKATLLAAPAVFTAPICSAGFRSRLNAPRKAGCRPTLSRPRKSFTLNCLGSGLLSLRPGGLVLLRP
jgi:hypothetical protein